MKIVSLMAMLIVMLLAPIAGAYSYRYADNSVDPNLEPKINHVNSKENQEREIRELLLQRLKQERQVYTHGEMSYANDMNSDFVAISKTDEARKIIKSQLKRTLTLTWFVLGGLVLIGLITEKYWLSLGVVICFALDKFVLPHNKSIVHVKFNILPLVAFLSGCGHFASAPAVPVALYEKVAEAFVMVARADGAQVAVFDGGYAVRGKYPKDMWDALGKAGFTVRVVKMAGDSWFCADETGSRYNYSM